MAGRHSVPTVQKCKTSDRGRRDPGPAPPPPLGTAAQGPRQRLAPGRIPARETRLAGVHHNTGSWPRRLYWPINWHNNRWRAAAGLQSRGSRSAEARLQRPGPAAGKEADRPETGPWKVQVSHEIWSAKGLISHAA